MTDETSNLSNHCQLSKFTLISAFIMSPLIHSYIHIRSFVSMVFVEGLQRPTGPHLLPESLLQKGLAAPLGRDIYRQKSTLVKTAGFAIAKKFTCVGPGGVSSFTIGMQHLHYSTPNSYRCTI